MTAVTAIGELFYTGELSDATRKMIQPADLITIAANTMLYDLTASPRLKTVFGLITELGEGNATCIEVYTIATDYKIQFLADISEKYILQNFKKVWADEANREQLRNLDQLTFRNLFFASLILFHTRID